MLTGDMLRRSAERLPEAEAETILGCAVPLLKLAADDREAAAMAVLARLSLPPFAGTGAGPGCCGAAK